VISVVKVDVNVLLIVTTCDMVIVVHGGTVGNAPVGTTPVPVGGGVGPSWMLVGISVTIPGFSGMWSAQIPVKYDRASWTSSSDAPQAWIQLMTADVNSEEGQKHEMSLLESQSGSRPSQVFRHFGTTFGHGASGIGGAGIGGAGVVVGSGTGGVEEPVGSTADGEEGIYELGSGTGGSGTTPDVEPGVLS
jgi:hypothetical protein